MWHFISLEDNPASGITMLFIPNKQTNYQEELGVDIDDLNPQRLPFVMLAFNFSKDWFEDAVFKKYAAYIQGEDAASIAIVNHGKLASEKTNRYLLCFVGVENIKYLHNELIDKVPTFNLIGRQYVSRLLSLYAESAFINGPFADQIGNFDLAPVIDHIKDPALIHKIKERTIELDENLDHLVQGAIKACNEYQGKPLKFIFSAKDNHGLFGWWRAGTLRQKTTDKPKARMPERIVRTLNGPGNIENQFSLKPTLLRSYNEMLNLGNNPGELKRPTSEKVSEVAEQIKTKFYL